MIDFIEKFKGGIKKIENALLKDHYRACLNLSSDLLRASEISDYPEGVFFGEFLESLFGDISSLDLSYELDQYKDAIKTEVLPTLTIIQKLVPVQDPESKSNVYEHLVKTRYFITRLQLNTWREQISRREIRRAVRES